MEFLEKENHITQFLPDNSDFLTPETLVSRHKMAKKAAVRCELVLMAKEPLPSCLGTDTKIAPSAPYS